MYTTLTQERIKGTMLVVMVMIMVMVLMPVVVVLMFVVMAMVMIFFCAFIINGILNPCRRSRKNKLYINI